MFADETLEKIFADERLQNIPLLYQSIIIRVIEETLEKEKENAD